MLIDRHIGSEDGIDALQRLRACDGTRGARAIAIMSDWPAGRVRRALKLGAPKSAKGVRPHDLRVWAAEQEARLAIQPVGVMLVGAIVPTAGGP